MRHHNQRSGFALLMSLIVVSVVVSVVLGLVELTRKQLRLSTWGKDSESSFHAANAGAECMRYFRYAESNEFEAGDAVSVSCFGESATGASVSNDLDASALAVYHYQYTLNWPSGGPVRCGKVDMLTISSNPEDSVGQYVGVQADIPTYPSDSITCPAGGRCTILSVKGYNARCADIAKSGVIEREVLLDL